MTEPYDIDEPEGSPKNIHITKKDLKLFVFALVILAVLLTPIYYQLKMNADLHLCKTNMEQIGKAVGLYAAGNDDRLPPVYATAGPDVPYLDEHGHPFTWQTLVAQYMNTRATFVCPSAQDDEVTSVIDPESSSKALPTTYGMYLPLGGVLISNVTDPDEETLIAETSNAGSQGSYDPVPFKTLTGSLSPQDGFAIGWSNSNSEPNKDSTAVTRLAFRDTAHGGFEQGTPRHRGGVYFLSVSNSLHLAPPAAARITTRGGEILGNWWAPPSEDR